MLTADAGDIADQRRRPLGKDGRASINVGIEMTESEVRPSLRNTSVVGIAEVIQRLALEV
jgi:hypothetical protein